MKFWDVVLTGLGVFAGTAIGAGLGAAIYYSSAEREGNPMFVGAMLGLAAAIAIRILIGVARKSATERRSEAQAIQAQQRARETAALAEAESRRAAASQAGADILWWAREATALFSWMPSRLQSASENFSRARVAFGDGAFSPFWSAVEASYADLALYLSDAERIADAAVQHAAAVERLGALAPLDAELVRFPINLDVDKVRAQHELILRPLDALVYDAQKQPTFATIWEQRRTTSAVIEGFRNLEDAVRTMGTHIVGAIASLGTQLERNNNEVTALLSRQAASTNEILVQQREASADQLAEMREMRESASQIREHLYYPELSRWLH